MLDIMRPRDEQKGEPDELRTKFWGVVRPEPEYPSLTGRIGRQLVHCGA